MECLNLRSQETLARTEAAETAEERLARLIAVRFTRQRLLATPLVNRDFRTACYVARWATPDARLT